MFNLHFYVSFVFFSALAENLEQRVNIIPWQGHAGRYS
ncbi:hypothetical protein BSI_25460 [Bacillus inaquosorum KCTC 13429]|uniref:Uncharacterized protein n=1 Tax=Bacillus inaquosorum KCTC 13429 TaxID=1236548 RepID=A0A9W5LI34_9BACI|nr:hypothetical protein BSI_25460 [Bacillus inaquosorum KCTC 13429]